MANEFQQDDQQEQQPQQQQGYPPYYYQKEDKADLLDKIRPDIIVTQVRHYLMGEDLIDDKWVKIPFMKDQALSEEGAWQISTLMLAVSSQNVSISNLTDVEIKRRALSIARTAQYMCIGNLHKFGIKRTDQLDFVNEIVFSNSLVTLKHPFEAGVRKFIQGTRLDTHMYSNNEAPKQSWLSSVFKARERR